MPHRRRLALTALALTCLLPAMASAASPYRSPQQILDASAASDWRTPDPANLLYMDLPAGRVIIELAPQFAPRHVANIQTFAHENLLGRHQHLPFAGQLRGAVR